MFANEAISAKIIFRLNRSVFIFPSTRKYETAAKVIGAGLINRLIQCQKQCDVEASLHTLRPHSIGVTATRNEQKKDRLSI